MRPDVKLGVVVSTVFVTVAGTYFLIQDRRESAIPVSSDPAALAGTGDKAPPIAAKRKPRRASRSGAKRAATRKARPVTLPTRNAATREASRRTPKGTPLAHPRIDAASTRNPYGTRQDGSAANTGTKRGSAPTTVLTRRSRNGRGTQHKRARRKAPKPQLTLTATPGDAIDAVAERHRVQQGDTMASLAKQYYGSTQFEAFLISHNKQLADPARLHIGEIVNIVPRSTESQPHPVRSETVAHKVSAPVLREYRIKRGDSFYRIARDVLGDAARWTELFELNKKVVGNDPSKLKIGQVIVLPKK